MSRFLKNAGFGRKNADERAVSFAEMLLSGKPLARPVAAIDMVTPKFKVKRKAQFGRNVATQFAASATSPPEHSSSGAPPWWRLWGKE